MGGEAGLRPLLEPSALQGCRVCCNLTGSSAEGNFGCRLGSGGGRQAAQQGGSARVPECGQSVRVRMQRRARLQAVHPTVVSAGKHVGGERLCLGIELRGGGLAVQQRWRGSRRCIRQGAK